MSPGNSLSLVLLLGNTTWSEGSVKTSLMGKAGNALRQALKAHRISQNRLAIAMGINAGVVSRWVSESRDPLAEALFETYRALQTLKPEAAEEFIQLFLKDAKTDEVYNRSDRLSIASILKTIDNADSPMTTHEQAISKLRQMPESLVNEVADFIDFLITKHKQNHSWLQSAESLELVESDFSDYLKNLEDYEDRLARGEIQW